VEPHPDWSRAWLTHPRSHSFITRYESTQDSQNCFPTYGAPSNAAAFYRPNMTTPC
jgi:hypothetical protein